MESSPSDHKSAVFPGAILAYGQVNPESVINVLGVTYFHVKTEDGGDLYLTRFGLTSAEYLRLENWYDAHWFNVHRHRLAGTSSVYRVPTRPVNGTVLDLVVKNCRVGEDVPVLTHTLQEFINAEFNSPWEEFALVMELRDGAYGPTNIRISTQRPLAIYVPPDRLQLWQTGRSRSKINKIITRHPGIALDILRQYKLVYQWIHGLNIIESYELIGIQGERQSLYIEPIMKKSVEALAAKGFAVADMKPAHIIISEESLKEMEALDGGAERKADFLLDLVERGVYAVVDYELLLRTPAHEEEVASTRRHFYLDEQLDRFKPSPLPPYLHETEIFGVPYVHGHVESTGGMLWVVGRNPRLFDFFLPERWRKTPQQPLSTRNEIFFTVTKDNVRIVWKVSRVGEAADPADESDRLEEINEIGFNSPFEEVAIAQYLSENGIPTINLRAIYMTGGTKVESISDRRRYRTHRELLACDGRHLLREDRDYIMIRGYYNGPDTLVASQEGGLHRPFNLIRAAEEGVLPKEDGIGLLFATRRRLNEVGYDGRLLRPNDLLVCLDGAGRLVRDAEGRVEARICNFELIQKL